MNENVFVVCDVEEKNMIRVACGDTVVTCDLVPDQLKCIAVKATPSSKENVLSVSKPR